jgi:hypothetical protein
MSEDLCEGCMVSLCKKHSMNNNKESLSRRRDYET